jgi:hypothetical protein
MALLIQALPLLALRRVRDGPDTRRRRAGPAAAIALISQSLNPWGGLRPGRQHRRNAGGRAGAGAAQCRTTFGDPAAGAGGLWPTSASQLGCVAATLLVGMASIATG